jgi:hypothetical protein
MQTSVVLRPTKRSDHHGVAEHRQLWRWSVDPSGRQGCLMYINRVLKYCLPVSLPVGHLSIQAPQSRVRSRGRLARCCVSRRGSVDRLDSGRSAAAAGTSLHAPFSDTGRRARTSGGRDGGSVTDQQSAASCGSDLAKVGSEGSNPKVVEKPTQPVFVSCCVLKREKADESPHSTSGCVCPNRLDRSLLRAADL